jgi:hypothetical protein
MTKVNLPPGCMGFKAKDGTRYVAKAGTHVDVADHHMPALRSQDYASAGLVDAGPEKLYIQDKKKQGRWCKTCNRLWNAWNKVCTKCGGDTIPEAEMEVVKLEGFYRP